MRFVLQICSIFSCPKRFFFIFLLKFYMLINEPHIHIFLSMSLKVIQELYKKIILFVIFVTHLYRGCFESSDRVRAEKHTHTGGRFIDNNFVVRSHRSLVAGTHLSKLLFGQNFIHSNFVTTSSGRSDLWRSCLPEACRGTVEVYSGFPKVPNLVFEQSIGFDSVGGAVPFPCSV